MPETRHAIEITWLTKSFGDNMVLRGSHLTVPTGSVCALLGTNGAGKTTHRHHPVHVARRGLGNGPRRRVRRRHRRGVGTRVIGVTGQFSAVDDLLTGI